MAPMRGCGLWVTVLVAVMACMTSATSATELENMDPMSLIQKVAVSIPTKFWREFSVRGSAVYYLPSCVADGSSSSGSSGSSGRSSGGSSSSSSSRSSTGAAKGSKKAAFRFASRNISASASASGQTTGSNSGWTDSASDSTAPMCERNTVKMSFSLYSKLPGGPADADAPDNGTVLLDQWILEGSTYQEYSASPGVVFKSFYKDMHKLSGTVKVTDDKWMPQMCEFLHPQEFFDTATKSYIPVSTRNRYADKSKKKVTLPESKFTQSDQDGCPCETLKVVIAGRTFTLVFNRVGKLRLVFSRDIKIEIDQWFPNKREFGILPSNLDKLMAVCGPKKNEKQKQIADAKKQQTLDPSVSNSVQAVLPPELPDKTAVPIDNNDPVKLDKALFVGDKRAIDQNLKLRTNSKNSNSAGNSQTGSASALSTSSFLETESGFPVSLLEEADKIHASVAPHTIDWHPQESLHAATDAIVLLEAGAHAKAGTGAKTTVQHTVTVDPHTKVEFHSVTHSFGGVAEDDSLIEVEDKSDKCDQDDKGDGYCDSACNNAANDFDGGDCCRGTCGVDGSVNYACGSKGFTCKSDQISSRPACLFLHGAGETGPPNANVTFSPNRDASGVPAIGIKYYWGDYAVEFEGGCKSVTYSWARTKDFPWTDKALYEPYYYKAKEIYSARGVVFAHSMGNVILGGACYLNDSMCDVKYFNLAGPLRGSMVADTGVDLLKVPGLSWVLSGKVNTGIKSLVTTARGMMAGPDPNGLAKKIDSKKLLLGGICGVSAWGAGGLMGVGLALVRQIVWGTFVCKKTFLGICIDWDTVEADGYVHRKECGFVDNDRQFGTFKKDSRSQWFLFDGNHGDATGSSGNHDNLFDWIRLSIEGEATKARSRKLL